MRVDERRRHSIQKLTLMVCWHIARVATWCNNKKNNTKIVTNCFYTPKWSSIKKETANDRIDVKDVKVGRKLLAHKKNCCALKRCAKIRSDISFVHNPSFAHDKLTALCSFYWTSAVYMKWNIIKKAAQIVTIPPLCFRLSLSFFSFDCRFRLATNENVLFGGVAVLASITQQIFDAITSVVKKRMYKELKSKQWTCNFLPSASDANSN